MDQSSRPLRPRPMYLVAMCWALSAAKVLRSEVDPEARVALIAEGAHAVQDAEHKYTRTADTDDPPGEPEHPHYKFHVRCEHTLERSACVEDRMWQCQQKHKVNPADVEKMNLCFLQERMAERMAPIVKDCAAQFSAAQAAACVEKARDATLVDEVNNN